VHDNGSAGCLLASIRIVTFYHFEIELPASLRANQFILLAFGWSNFLRSPSMDFALRASLRLFKFVPDKFVVAWARESNQREGTWAFFSPVFFARTRKWARASKIK
jgi:hypothetical protein